jgi:hypothetical protein
MAPRMAAIAAVARLPALATGPTAPFLDVPLDPGPVELELDAVPLASNVELLNQKMPY